MLTDLEKLQRRATKLAEQMERQQKRRDLAEAELLQRARRISAADRLLKSLHRRREKVIEAISALARNERRKQKAIASSGDGSSPAT